MSTLKVEIVKIDDIRKHPDADRLDLVTIKGWQCVAGKDEFKKGDRAVYIPIDSILSESLEEKLFKNSKIKLNNHRVKSIKIRGAISQGMLVSLKTLELEGKAEGDDVTILLGITKYEPPVEFIGAAKGQKSIKQSNTYFRKYTDIENFKNFNDIFKDNEGVSVTEKIHGTNFRCGYVHYDTNTILKKVLKFLGLAPKYEFVYGSHNIQLQENPCEANIYWEIVEKYKLRQVLKPGEVVYGEIYGDGIQKGYTYGCQKGVREIVFFDVMVNGKYLDNYGFRCFFVDRRLPLVPEIYFGPFSLKIIKDLMKKPSQLSPAQSTMEGVVIKPYKEEASRIGRKVLKFINDGYLLQKDLTEFH